VALDGVEGLGRAEEERERLVVAVGVDLLGKGDGPLRIQLEKNSRCTAASGISEERSPHAWRSTSRFFSMSARVPAGIFSAGRR